MPESLQFSFSDGVLAITGPLSKIRLRWRPSPSAEELLPNEKEWLPFLPEFRLLQPLGEIATTQEPPPHSPDPRSTSFLDMAEKKRLAFAAFRAELPDAFPPHVERFPSHQWPLLALLHDSPSTIDLAACTPILAWCLANNHHFRERQSKSAALLAVVHSHQKQRDILEWLGFPGTESVVRMMRKIPPEAASPTILNGLRLALKSPDPIPIGFSHLKKLNAGVIALVSTPLFYPLLTPSLLEEVSENDAELEFPQTASSLMDVATIYKATKSSPPTSPARSIEQCRALLLQAEVDYQNYLHRKAEEARTEEALRREARRQAARLRRARRLEAAERDERERRHQQAVIRDLIKGKSSFPPPPIPGTEFIIPLTHPNEMEKESREQVNCVRTYIYRVTEGTLYFYRVMAPERATLSIVKRPDGSWRRCELKSYKNGAVSKETERSIDNWLAPHRISV